MKTYLFRLLLASLVTSTIFAIPPISEHSLLVGSWRNLTEDGTKGMIRFHDDQTFDGELDYVSRPDISYSGKWKLINDKLFYNYESPDSKMEDVDKIVKLTEKILIVETQSGKQYTYYRVEEEKLNQAVDTTPYSRSAPFGRVSL